MSRSATLRIRNMERKTMMKIGELIVGVAHVMRCMLLYMFIGFYVSAGVLLNSDARQMKLQSGPSRKRTDFFLRPNCSVQHTGETD